MLAVYQTCVFESYSYRKKVLLLSVIDNPWMTLSVEDSISPHMACWVVEFRNDELYMLTSGLEMGAVEETLARKAICPPNCTVAAARTGAIS